MDLLVNRDSTSSTFGDMVFVNGETPVTENFTDSVAQRVFVLLRTFENEWYLNQTTGIPYIERILGHKTDKSTIDRIIQQKILQEPGVADISEFVSTLNSSRVYEANMRIRDTSGGVFIETLLTE